MFYLSCIRANIYTLELGFHPQLRAGTFSLSSSPGVLSSTPGRIISSKLTPFLLCPRYLAGPRASSLVLFFSSLLSLFLLRGFEVTVLFSSSLDLDGPAFSLLPSPFLSGAILYAHHRRVFQTSVKKTLLTRPNFAISDTHPITEQNGTVFSFKQKPTLSPNL